MDISGTLVRQLITMFLYMGVGFVLFRIKLISKEGSRELASLLLYVIMPCVILRSFAMDYSAERLRGLGLAFVLSLGALAFSAAFCALVFRGRPIDSFGASYSNAGYMGIPLVAAALGSEAVFYCSAFVAILNLMQWTLGVLVMTGKREYMSPKKFLINPVIISVFLGIALFFAPFSIPPLLDGAIATVGNMNSPIAMIILGCYLAQCDLKGIFLDKSLYLGSLVRLLVVPLITLAAFALVPGYTLVKQAVLVVACAPIGSNVAIFAHLFGQDYTRAVKTVCQSTLLCVFTMPLVFAASNWLF